MNEDRLEIDELLDNYSNIQYIHGVSKPNWILIPVTNFPQTAEYVEEFNRIYECCMRGSYFFKIRRTPSGGISVKHFLLPAWDCRQLLTLHGKFKGVELTIITYDHTCRIQFAAKPEKDINGHKAFNLFCNIFKTKYHMNLYEEKWQIKNGKEVKSQIVKPLIGLTDLKYKDVTLRNVHHLDYHSSFSLGLAITHPEFRDGLEYMFNQRHDRPIFKDILNLSIGYMQSQFVGYKYAHLSRDAINNNYDRVLAKARQVRKAGGTVLSFNTDGFWYVGPIYHDDEEGTEFGTWQNDHVNCLWRAKSDGCYEYIEDGKYHPVVRGKTLYDRIKPRTEWEWGDIYRNDVVTMVYTWIEGEGIKGEKYEL